MELQNGAVPNKMKIVYVYATFTTTGGTERILTEKINRMTENMGYDVTCISCFQHPNEKNSFPMSEKVKQINLGIPYFSQYKYKYPQRLWVRWRLYRQLRKSITHTVKQIDPDILIGVSRFKANLISTIKCRAKKIIECHVVKGDTIFHIGNKRSFPVRVYYAIAEFLYIRAVERNADVIVTLTEKDKRLWKRAKRVEVIPNFSTLKVSQRSDCTVKRVIAVGRLEWEKGFGRLLEIWKIISFRHPDWYLDIFGRGRMHDTLLALIKLNKINRVAIHDFTPDISAEYASSSICVVTSYFESFSLVLLEALKHGLPCVAYDCPFGPESIIEDARCGFLVHDGEKRLFAERVCRLIEDQELRTHFSAAAIERSKAYDADVVMNQWNELFKSLV